MRNLPRNETVKEGAEPVVPSSKKLRFARKVHNPGHEALQIPKGKLKELTSRRTLTFEQEDSV
jgi:hypothetical protein